MANPRNVVSNNILPPSSSIQQSQPCPRKN
jgi:hypothetical protein